MEAPVYWGVAGQPISHSVTPKLFSIVGDAMGLVQAEQIFVEASGEEEFYSKVGMLDGDLWLSCTAPLSTLCIPDWECKDLWGLTQSTN